jgi:phosphate transport system permease protein
MHMVSGHPNLSVPRLVTLILALAPVVVLLAVIATIAAAALPAVTQVGLPVLFSNEFSNRFSGTWIRGQYGLMPSLWGTLLVASVALGLAFPISLAMAIFINESPWAWPARILETIVGLFAGIPPVLYGFMAILVARAFMQPNFAGAGLSHQTMQGLRGLPPLHPTMLPRENSVLLGGMLLALLIIPFMAPLMLDALRNVPANLVEGSLALGANHWLTLRRIALPLALPGIMSAATLGILKAIGDVMVVAFAVGMLAEKPPQPLWDVFQPTASLTGSAAGLLGGMVDGGITSAPPLDRSVAFFAGFMLLVMAFGILGLASFLQRLALRRYSQ